MNEIPGWETTDPKNGFEVQRGAAGSPQEGNYLIELAAHTRSGIQTSGNLGLHKNHVYVLTFYFSARPNTSEDEN